MGKVDRVVLRETGYIAAWTLIFSAVTQAVFLIIGAWDLTVLFGNLLSGVAGILNFFFMGLTVQKSLDKEEKDAKLAMRVSNAVRLLALFIVALVGGLLPSVFSIWTVLIPLIFPRIAIFIRPFFGRKDAEFTANTANNTGVAGADDTDGDDADGDDADGDEWETDRAAAQGNAGNNNDAKEETDEN